MPLGEVFLSAFISALFRQLASPELWKFLQKEGLYSKIKKWESTLTLIQAVLADAGKKHITNKAVEKWLDDMQELAYDVQDLLDEFETEALRRKLKKERHNHKASSSKVPKLLHIDFGNWSLKAFKSWRNMESALDDVTGRLEELYKHGVNLGLREIPGGDLPSSTATAHWTPQTANLRTEPAIGRDQDKERVVQMMMREAQGDAKFQVTTIVGMGGIGKTTLAREVYHDIRMEDFKPKAWVCISDDFDVLRISNAILSSMTSSSCDYKVLNVVQNKLKEEVAGKKFLLILDDLWSENYGKWENLMSPFMSSPAQGSKIIVTTRLKPVAFMIDRHGCFELKLMSNEDCWSLFKKHAFPSGSISAFGDIDLIREKVIEKCNGLPLLAKVLSGVLRAEEREEKWVELLNSELWESLEKDEEISLALKLSYYHLPSYLKRCFTYCAIFPKDYEFKENKLIHLWMAEDLLPKSNESRSQEDLGHDYFYELVTRSIFQESSKENNMYVMHDLVSDLAQWASRGTCFSSDVSGVNVEQSNLGKLRYYSYVCGEYDGKKKFEALMSKAEQHERLRTFLSLKHWSTCYVSQALLHDMLPKFKRLRTLNLKGYYVTEIPESFGELKHMRYFNLSNTKIRNLSKSICSLINLRILKLKRCYSLTELPSKLSNLINLRHLNVRGTKLSKMPVGMGELKLLRVLTDFVVGKSSGAGINDLKLLKSLHRKLRISKLENVKYASEVNEMILSDMKDIRVLQLEWSSSSDDDTRDDAEKHVLNMLQPHGNLEELTIRCFSGVEFPTWLGSSFLSNVTIVRLENCERCTSLPSLGRLCNLKELFVGGMKGIKSIGHEFYGEGCLNPFPSLESLSFAYLVEWELWEASNGNEHVQVFSRLHSLSIVRCPKLYGQLPDDLSSLENLTIRRCPELIVSFSSLLLVDVLEIEECNKISCTDQVVLKSTKSICLRNILECSKWLVPLFEKDIHVEKAPQQKLPSFALLRDLYIVDCSNLISLDEVCYLTNLHQLHIGGCDALASLPDGMYHSNPHLKSLCISDCNSLAYIIKGQPPPSMSYLRISNCGKIKWVFDDKENSENRSTCLLLNTSSARGQLPEANFYLAITGCTQLESISSSRQLPERMYDCRISDAPMLESPAERFHHDTTNLEAITINNCENLKYIIPEGMDKLSHLKRIYLWNCPNIVRFSEGGLPNTISCISIKDCEKLEALPNHLHILDSMREMGVKGCSSIKSFTEHGFPTNLTSLEISNNENMFKEVAEWGFHNLTSLTSLSIEGCQDAESFPQEELGMRLPPTLTELSIKGFPKLKCLSSNGFQNLTSLEKLVIDDCPNLTSFPKQGFPSSLLSLKIEKCPLLKAKCKRDKGKEWSKIAQIPCVEIDGRFIYDPVKED